MIPNDKTQGAALEAWIALDDDGCIAWTQLTYPGQSYGTLHVHHMREVPPAAQPAGAGVEVDVDPPADSPLPWRVIGDRTGNSAVLDVEGGFVAIRCLKDDAKFIVRTANAYRPLVETLAAIAYSGSDRGLSDLDPAHANCIAIAFKTLAALSQEGPQHG